MAYEGRIIRAGTVKTVMVEIGENSIDNISPKKIR